MPLVELAKQVFELLTVWAAPAVGGGDQVASRG